MRDLRQGEHEGRAARAPLEADAAAVRQRHLLHDGQTEAAAADARGVMAAEERLENVPGVAGADAGPAVFDADEHLRILPFRGDADPLPLGAVTDGVRDEVLHGP